ncbi:hypothetical protein [Asaia sp. VD9]
MTSTNVGYGVTSTNLIAAAGEVVAVTGGGSYQYSSCERRYALG